MRTPVWSEGVVARLASILEVVPLTPWWWLARRRNHDRQLWIRHVRSYYGVQPDRR